MHVCVCIYFHYASQIVLREFGMVIQVKTKKVLGRFKLFGGQGKAEIELFLFFNFVPLDNFFSIVF